jgi:hypothetical protein
MQNKADNYIVGEGMRWHMRGCVEILSHGACLLGIRLEKESIHNFNINIYTVLVYFSQE